VKLQLTVNNLLNPTDDQDAATKKCVDENLSRDRSMGSFNIDLSRDTSNFFTNAFIQLNSPAGDLLKLAITHAAIAVNKDIA
jgi:hypothetical protein